MKKVCLVAVDIRSTHNVGSFFRTCDGFGADLILVGITPRPMNNNDGRLPHVAQKSNKAIAKTALGAEETVDWQYFEDIEKCIEYLKQNQYRVIAIEQDKNSKSMSELKITKPTALLVGPEVEGFSTDILGLCDDIYEIPMTGKKESYNVAVSAGIALYQATKI